MGRKERIIEQLVVSPGSRADIADRDPGWTGGRDYEGLSQEELKAEAKAVLARGVEDLSEAQELLWASDTHSLLVVLQAMDAAGKDSAIEHVMTGVNPQGVQVVSFRAPSSEELDHDFLWRISRGLPERGRIGIFNRSHYEEVVALRVHPEWLAVAATAERSERARDSGRSATRTSTRSSGTSTGTGRRSSSCSSTSPRRSRSERFLARLDTPHKEWKFNAADVAERGRWDDYMSAFEDALTATSTPWAPWYVVPADHKWLTQALIAQVLVEHVGALDLRWPEVSAADHTANLAARKRLEAEP